MKRVLITGAGSYVGEKVRARLEQEPNLFEVTELDMQDDAWRSFDFAGFDCIFHVAGIAHVSTDPKMESLYYKVNRDLAIEVGERAKKAGVSQVIFMSSAIVYGDSYPHNVFSPIDKQTPVSPANFYGRSKVEAEQGLAKLEDDAFSVAVLRCPMIYGPGCKGNFPKLIKMAKRLHVFPRINNRRSMLYVGNLAELVARLAASGASGLYLPQNAEWSSTSELVSDISACLQRRVWLTSLFNPLINLVFRSHPYFIKAFGNMYYTKESADASLGYQLYSLKDSIRCTVVGTESGR